MSREALEAHLDRLAARTPSPVEGLYGPGSATWEVSREAAIMLGGGCAALMQVAHPYVAHAIDQHSKTRTDPVGRFVRTFTHVFAMVFGDLEEALDSARRVHTVHMKIHGAIREDVGRFRRGHRYHANDPDGLLWVHATLIDTAMRVHDLLVRPLRPSEREAYYAESKRFAHLFGIPDVLVPDSLADFERYYASMIASDTIAVGSAAREIRRYLFAPPTPAHAPLMGWFEAFTASLMPPDLRDAFDLPADASARAMVQRSLPIIRTTIRALPDRFRYFPAYSEASRRARGKAPRAPVARFVESALIRSMRPRGQMSSASAR